MSHGWGGTAAALRPDAIAFARAGYLVVTFDYRGWGKSDSRLILAGKPLEKKDGKLVAEVKEVREVVDPIDQTTDIMNAIHWVVGEKQCDPDRIGLWGSSYSGGHVVYVAARDPRVKAFVSQVGAMDSRWAIANPQMKAYTYGQATARTAREDRLSQARGEVRQPDRPAGHREDGGLRARSRTSAAARTARSCSSSPRTRNCSTTRTTRSWPTSGPRGSRSSSTSRASSTTGSTTRPAGRPRRKRSPGLTST